MYSLYTVVNLDGPYISNAARCGPPARARLPRVAAGNWGQFRLSPIYLSPIYFPYLLPLLPVFAKIVWPTLLKSIFAPAREAETLVIAVTAPETTATFRARVEGKI